MQSKRENILTDCQWNFLRRYAVGHNTTLEALAEHLLQGARLTAAVSPKKAKARKESADTIIRDRKFIRDRERCAAAIAVLEHAAGTSDHRFCAHDDEHKKECCESAALELDRMRRAYLDAALLWSIYRRSETKATEYAMPAIVGKAA